MQKVINSSTNQIYRYYITILSYMSPDVERRQAKVMCVYKYSVYYMVTRLISKFFLYLHCTYNQQRLLNDLKIDNRI